MTTKKCNPCPCSKCYPCVCPLPSPTLPPLVPRGGREANVAAAKQVLSRHEGSGAPSSGIVFQAESTLKATMGTLHPEDFFDSAKRVAKQEESRDRFNEFLLPRGLRVEHVLIRYPQYHEAVQARIEARNIQEQTKQKNTEEAKLAQAQGALNEVIKQGEANLSIKLMEGSNFVTRTTAQMEAYQRKQASQANRIIAFAEAEKQRMLNEAYQGVGADRLVGLGVHGREALRCRVPDRDRPLAPVGPRRGDPGR